jgi:hypothetical protein
MCVVFKLGELFVVCVLEEVSCLTSMNARWCGSDKREGIKIWKDRINI